MYEQFTDRARRVMQLANQEAMRWNHEYVGAEHIMRGEPERLRLWAAVIIAYELADDFGPLRPRDAKAVQERRQRLKGPGGPPGLDGSPGFAV
jgi:hypothetical protein